MRISVNGINLIKEFEGLKLESYLCPANVPTIGIGSTRYENGVRVQLGETITEQKAVQMLNHEATQISLSLQHLNLNQNQFDAVVSFVYNFGLTAFKNSTLYKLIKQNPNNPLIAEEFKKWKNIRVGNKLVPKKGLIRRRQAEIDLYFKEIVTPQSTVKK